ncbi:MAG TPA: 30S ribosomal protein S1 [Nitrospirales bacterium]|nr:30S ribosomal protein S1 [Nitrospirales bacterium]
MDTLEKMKLGASDKAEMAAMYEQTFQNFEEGSVIEGTVVTVKKDKVIVDIGYKSEGIIAAEEFSPQELAALTPGTRIPVYIEEREDSEGNLILSKEKADKMKVWEDLERIFKEEAIVDGRILSRIKGGMMVDIGVKAFLPGSQIDLHPVRDPEQLIGKTYPMKIIKINHRRGNVVVSRRLLLEESRDQRRQRTLSNLTEGQLVTGTVKNITEYGAFVDLGGIDGLLHITDMSWGRIGHPSEIFMVGDRVEVMVLRYDRESGRVSLGLKQKSSDPWTGVAAKYPVGTRIKGRVVSLTDYGAFIELEPGVEGLVHVSEMSWTHEVRHPSKIVSVGDQVEAQVLSVDEGARKISLGMKQAAPNPWDLVEKKYPAGTKIEGVVKSLTDFGAFIGLDEGVDGLIHISDMSWTKHVKHPSEIFKKGQKVEAIVLRIDKEKERLSLGHKQLAPDPWEREIPGKHQVGNTTRGKVTKITDFGVFVELEGGVEGLIHISETGLEPNTRMDEKFKVAAEIEAKIIKVDKEERKIALSLREHRRDSERQQMQDYHATQGPVDQSLGRAARKHKRRDGEGEDEEPQ